MDIEALSTIFQVSGFISSVLIGLGTSSWLLGIGTFFGFTAIYVGIAAVLIAVKEVPSSS